MQLTTVLLCAGFGTRLHPLTQNQAKPLLDVGGRPLLDDLMDRCVHDGGLRDFVLVSNGRFVDDFRDWWASSASQWPQASLRIVDDGAQDNDTRLGALRDLQLAIDTLGLEAPLFVAAADNLVRFDLRAFLTDYEQHPRNLVVAYSEPRIAARRRGGVAEVDAAGRVTRFVEKSDEPPGDLVCPPFYIWQADALAQIPELLRAEPQADAPGGLVAWVSPQLAVYVHAMRGQRYDIGSLESYREAVARVTSEASTHRSRG